MSDEIDLQDLTSTRLGGVIVRRAAVRGGPWEPPVRDLVEWALGVETLVELGDPLAPARRVGREVLEILAGVEPQEPDH